MPDHSRWMRRALELARQGEGRTHPNPLVGSVIVKGDRLIAEGYHHAFGRPHAEVEAIRKAGPKARGARLYVNLEPCAHWGKTPPCAEAIERAGVKEVVSSFQDPNPLVGGKGFGYLRKRGIQVTTGVLEKEARFLNRAFLWWMQSRRPYVTLKIAASLDGRIATSDGESQWITGPPARRAGHLLRAQADAIAVGIETVLKDNPELTSHGQGRNPLRIVFDSHLRLPLKAKILNTAARTLVFTGAHSVSAQRLALEKRGIRVFPLPENRSGHVPILEALRVLGEMNITHLLVEGGGLLHASFLHGGMANEIVWFAAPVLIGNEGKAAVGALETRKLAAAPRLKDVRIETFGTDVCIRGTL